MQCWCKTYQCHGALKSTRTRYNHLKQDKNEKEVPSSESLSSIGDFDNYLDLSMYAKMPETSKLLYEGSGLTILEAVFEVFRDFVFTPNESKRSVSKRLKLLKEKFLPDNNAMPESFEKAMEIVEPLLVPIHRFNVCPNDCLIFRNQYSDLSICPVCSESRYKADGTTAERNFTYFPIVPRIRRMFATASIQDLLNEHFNAEITNGAIDDIQKSRMWKEDWFGEEGEFGKKKNSVVLNICLDGLNPYASQKIDYSIWPIELSILNFPPKLRKTCGGTLIAGIIPGNGHGEPKSLQPYLALLVDELKALESCEMRDSKGDIISVSVKLLNFTLDYPAIGKVLHFPGSARSFRGCPFCEIVGENCKACNKTLFLQNRRYLSLSHPMRLESVGHVRTIKEERGPPLLERTPQRTKELRKEYDSLKNENQRKRFTRTHGLKGTYNFMDLGYHAFERHLGPDPMHTIKDVLSNMAKIMNGTVKTVKLSESEDEFKGKDRPQHPISCQLNKEEITKVDHRIMSLIFPSQATGCKESFLTSPGKVHPTHAWHEYGTKNILMYLLHDCMHETTRRSLLFLLSILNRVCRYEIEEEGFDRLEKDMKLALAEMERDFPALFFNITTHFLIHEPETAKLKGPVHSRWMFHFERLNSVISRRVKSRKHPEASAIRTLRLMDWVMDVIIARRLPVVQKLDPSSSLEDVLLNALGNSNFDHNQRKRRYEHQLLPWEISQLTKLLQKPAIKNNFAKEVRWVKSNRLNDCGVVTYQSRGSKKPDDYSKSSRFVYLSEEQRFGEIVAIYEHIEDNKKYIWFHVDAYELHEYETETSLPRSILGSNTIRYITAIENISEPLIVGIDPPYIWFISIEHNSKFTWHDQFI